MFASVRDICPQTQPKERGPGATRPASVCLVAERGTRRYDALVQQRPMSSRYPRNSRARYLLPKTRPQERRPGTTRPSFLLPSAVRRERTMPPRSNRLEKFCTPYMYMHKNARKMPRDAAKYTQMQMQKFTKIHKTLRQRKILFTKMRVYFPLMPLCPAAKAQAFSNSRNSRQTASSYLSFEGDCDGFWRGFSLRGPSAQGCAAHGKDATHVVILISAGCVTRISTNCDRCR